MYVALDVAPRVSRAAGGGIPARLISAHPPVCALRYAYGNGRMRVWVWPASPVVERRPGQSTDGPSAITSHCVRLSRTQSERSSDPLLRVAAARRHGFWL